MIATNNPAGRLHHLLRELKNKGQVASMAALHEVLGVPETDKPLLYRRIGLLCDLPKQIIEQVESIPGENHKLLLSKIPKINNAIKTLNLQGPMTGFTQQFDESVFFNLEICSDLLSKHRPEKIIEKDELEKLKQEIEILIEETLSNNISKEIQNFIVKHLKIILFAIQEYKFSGTTKIEEAINETFGSIFTNHQQYKESIKTETGSKFWRFAGKLALVVSITGGLLQIGETLKDACPEIQKIIEHTIEEENLLIEDPICESFEYHSSNLKIESKT